MRLQSRGVCLWNPLLLKLVSRPLSADPLCLVGAQSCPFTRRARFINEAAPRDVAAAAAAKDLLLTYILEAAVGQLCVISATNLHSRQPCLLQSVTHAGF
jgi:hypothetical protein